ncbi:MAG: hypothetical protein AAFY72_15710, partial [Cyanobacteria bacterium J06649_4]
MSKPDWESLQVKVVRALFLAVSSVFVAFYGCAAVASEYEAQEKAVAAQPATKVVSKTAAPKPALASAISGVPLAQTMSVSAVATPTVAPVAEPGFVARAEQQAAPAIASNAASNTASEETVAHSFQAVSEKVSTRAADLAAITAASFSEATQPSALADEI